MKATLRVVEKVAGLVLLMALTGSALAQGQGNTKTDQEVKAAKKELDQASDKLQAARKAADQASRELRQAENAHQSAATAIKKARPKAAETHSEKLGLPKAIATRDAAQLEAKAIHEGLLNQLKGTAEFQAARKEEETAGEKFRALKDDSTLSPEQRRQREAELATVMRRPGDMQRAALAGSAGLQSAMRKAVESEAVLVKIQAELARAVEADPAVQAAIKKTKEAGDAEKAARVESNRAQKELNAAQSAVNREKQQLQKAGAEDRKTDQKAKQKNKKKD